MRNCMKNLKIYIKTARFLISNIKKVCNFYHLLARLRVTKIISYFGGSDLDCMRGATNEHSVGYMNEEQRSRRPNMNLPFPPKERDWLLFGYDFVTRRSYSPAIFVPRFLSHSKINSAKVNSISVTLSNCQFLATPIYRGPVVYRPYSGMLTPRSSSRPPACRSCFSVGRLKKLANL
jgi:hypothetical protein